MDQQKAASEQPASSNRLSIPIAQRIRHLLSPSRHDRDSESGRGAERRHRAVLSSITGIAARGAAMGASLITIPLTLHYLGNERFGLWMTISSVVALTTFADFGIGNGVLTAVAAASGRDDAETIRRAVSSAFAVLLGIGATLLTVFLTIYRFISWGDLFRASSPLARSEAGPAMFIFVACFTLNIPLDVVQRVQLGMQQGFRTNVWQICSSIASLAGIVGVVHFHGTVPELVGAFAGAPVLGTALNALHFFILDRRDLRPRWNLISRQAIAEIARLGGMFFLIQVVITFSFSMDNFIIARTLGVATVALYSIPQRMFSFISVIVFTLAMPLWPAYGEAVTRGDLKWVRRTLSRTLKCVLLGSICVAAMLLAVSHRILLLWVGPAIHPTFVLLFGLATWEIVRSYTGTQQMFLNGAGVMRFQTVTHCIFGAACICAKFWCARKYGIAGVPWAGVATYGMLILLPNLFYVPRLLGRMAAMLPRKAGPDEAISWNTVVES
jgi:O-antigen/teichoic acid export membrane protein